MLDNNQKKNIMFLSLPFWGRGIPHKEAAAGVGFTHGNGSWLKSKDTTPILDMLNAATILKSSGCDIQVYDAQFYRTKDFKGFFNHIKNYKKPNIAFVRTSLPTLNNDIRIIEKLRKEWPDTIYAVFGPCFYSDYVIDYVKYRNVYDMIISSEIEAVIEDVYKHSLSTEVSGVYKRKGQTYSISNTARLMCDLDKLPVPDYSLSEYSKLDRFLLQTSMGCPIACRFCPYYLSQGARLRKKSVDKTVKEIKNIVVQFKPKEILFRDPNFGFSRSRIHEICNAVLKHGIKFKWICETDLHTLTPSDLELMSKAGCVKIAFGIESANLKGMKEHMHGKPPKIDIIRRNLKICKTLGIKTRAMYILGIKGDTLEAIFETIKLSREMRADLSAFGLPNFYPGSNIFDDAMKAGAIPDSKATDKNIEYFETISTHNMPPMIFVDGIELEDLKLLKNFAYYINLMSVSPMYTRIKKIAPFYKTRRKLKKRLPLKAQQFLNSI